MRSPATVLATCACLILALFGAAEMEGAAPATTPVPTATPTPQPGEVSHFYGWTWAQDSAGGPITAKIGDVICGEGVMLICPPADPPPKQCPYEVDVLSEQTRAGCGSQGEMVSFFIGQERATQTAAWHAGTSQKINLSAGPRFAFFYGHFAFPRQLTSSGPNREQVAPFVGDRRCGWEIIPPIPMGEGIYEYRVIVDSSETQPGCGVEGAQVTFKLLGGQGNVIATAREEGMWQAWGGHNQGNLLNLTLVPVGAPPVTVVNVGDAPSQGAEGRWAGISVLAAAVGLAVIAAGAALRRRTAA